MRIHTFRVYFLTAVYAFYTLGVLAQSSATFRIVGRLDGATDRGRISELAEELQAFDISPDGKLLAVLSQSVAPDGSWLHLQIENVETGKTLVDSKLGTDARPALRDLPPWYVPHVGFSADQHFLAVQDWQSVRVVGLSSLQVERTFTSVNENLSVPLSIQSASKNNLLLINYGAKGPFIFSGFDNLTHPSVYNELVDISTGQRRASWHSMDISQSLSPDGKLAAISDWETSDILAEVEIVDTQTGQKLTTLHSGYKFGKPWDKDPHGRVIGKFLSEDEILLSPDEHIDRTGHRSGNALKIMRISDGNVVREIRPSNFGPTGDVITSASRDCFAILNWYASPGILKRDLDPPERSFPEFLVYPSPAKFRSYGISNLSLETMEINEYLGRSYSPRISNGATVVAIAQNGGIIVFQKK